MNLLERFWAKVAIPDDANACWEWTGGLWGGGYGSFRVYDRVVCAHRFAYEIVIGEIPGGLEIDHLCRNKKCVNPRHLEPVTKSVNMLRGDHQQRRKTHCPQGHEYSEENTYVHRSPSGVRRGCRTCRTAASLRYYRAHAHVIE